MEIHVTDKTLSMIRTEYIEAVKKASSIQEIVEILYNNLQNLEAEVPIGDESVFLTFLDGLRNCYRERCLTFELTNFATMLTTVVMYIIRWLNQSKGANIDLNWYARRKALKSDLTKILNKAIKDDTISVNIRDRFGIRGILLNKDDPSSNKINLIFEALRNILIRDSPFRKEFVNWYQNCNTVDQLHCLILNQFVCEIPFAITDIKDYISNPKANGYQSLQFTLQTSLYSPVLPGARIEFQLRDWNMHMRAEGHIGASEGDQSHFSYKKEIDPRIANVFELDNLDIVKLPGVKVINGRLFDLAGLIGPKPFADRMSL